MRRRRNRIVFALVYAVALFLLDSGARFVLAFHGPELKGYSSTLTAEIARVPRSFNGSYTVYGDFHGLYYNIDNGFRRTVGQPTHYDSTIWLFGNSQTFDQAVPDAQTMASALQALYNANGFHVRIMNAGIEGAQVQEMYQRLLDIDVRPQDTVMFLDGGIDAYNSARNRCDWNTPFAVVQLICYGIDHAPIDSASIAAQINRYEGRAWTYTRNHGALFFHFIQPDIDNTYVGVLPGIHLVVPSWGFAERLHLNPAGDKLLAHEVYDMITLM